MAYQLTYAKFLSMINPFFMQRGFPDLADHDAIMLYTNMSIQDIYNKDNYTFLYKTETLTPDSTQWRYNIFKTKHPIRKSWECFSPDVSWKMNPTLYSVKNNTEYAFEHWENVITTTSDITEITITYIKAYIWRDYADVVEWSKWSQNILPLPHSFIPALTKKVYDWAAPINLMAGETSEYDFHGHAEQRLRELIQDDSLTDNQSINLW